MTPSEIVPPPGLRPETISDSQSADDPTAASASRTAG